MEELIYVAQVTQVYPTSPGPPRSILRPHKSTNPSTSPVFVFISRIVVDYLFVDEVSMIGCRFL